MCTIGGRWRVARGRSIQEVTAELDPNGAELPAGEAYAHAILEAALDAVITIDHRGHVLEFNRAAERTFGRLRKDVLGRELAALIVPPEHRDAHRKALARWSESGPGPGAGRLLGERIEVEALRADGSRFPAELAISRVDVPGPPLFTACIRDVSEHKKAEDRIQTAEFRFRTLVEQLPLISYVDSSESAVSKPLYLSPQVETILGYTPDDWLSTPGVYERSIHPDDRERVLSEKQAAYDRGEPLRIEYRLLASDGRVVWVEDQSVPVEPPEGGAAFRQGFALDITERKQAEGMLRRAETRFRTLVEQLPLTVYIDRADDDSSNIYSSPQVESLLGYSPEEWRSSATLFTEVLHPDDRERVRSAHARTHATGEPLNVEYRLVARDGRVVWVHDEGRLLTDEDGRNRVLQGYLLDVTARRDAEEQLRHQAFHDALTELPNRALFTDRVEHSLVVHGEAGGEVAVLFVDLDDFKAVNDSFGHPAGDALLRAVAVRLREALAPSHSVARIGGDEFAVLVEDRSGLAAASDAAERLLTQFQYPFDVEDREVFVSASVGIALGDDCDELLRSASVAMYRAKESGGAQYVVYAPRMDEGATGRMELVADLRRASVEDEFVVHYQPIVELRTGALVGLEALVRWNHPRRGLLTPADFIALAEGTGRIVELGGWVLNESCRRAAAWRERLPELTISVNVSPRQVRRPALVGAVAAALESSGLDASALTVEITESVLAGPRDELVGVLHDVTGLGVVLALDDFGTGYSSLSLLQDLPVSTLKIDRAFVAALGTGRDRPAFAQAIVDLAQALGLAVVGEGIESPMQANALRRLGCRIGQGFYFAPPLTTSEVDALLAMDVAPTFPRRSGESSSRQATASTRLRSQAITSPRMSSSVRVGCQPMAAPIFSIEGSRWRTSSIPSP
jgi:diguanylate cyclase (GGDEF)-like protein/PAS domain S-box-containing protein